MRRASVPLLAVFISALICLGGMEAAGSLFDRSGVRIPEADLGTADINWDLLALALSGEKRGVCVLEWKTGALCSGTFIDVGGGPDAPAHILTAAHCIAPQLRPGEILRNVPARGGDSVIFSYFFDNPQPGRDRFPLDSLLIASMDRTDLAILKLKNKNSELMDRGIRPIKLSSRLPDGGVKAQAVGTPWSPLLPAARRYMYQAPGETKAIVHIQESVYARQLPGLYYDWPSVIAHNASISAGFSGGPLISVADGALIGVNITGISDTAISAGGAICSRGVPCEVDPSGNRRENPAVNYAVPVDSLMNCFDVAGTFEEKREGCVFNSSGI